MLWKATGLPYYANSAPVATSLASHDNSNGASQSGKANTGADVNSNFNLAKAAS